MRCTFSQSHKLKEFHGALLGFSLALAAYECRYHNILEGCEFGQKLMKLEHESYMTVAEIAQLLCRKAAHIYPIDNDFAAVRTVECAHYLQQCCLAGAARTDNAHHLTLVDVEVDALEHLKRAETLCYSFNVNHIEF